MIFIERQLYDWQERAVAYFMKHQNCFMECATGTGKTTLAVAIIAKVLEREPGLRVLIVVPKNVILEETWYPELTRRFGPRIVGIYYGNIKEEAQITITNMQSISGLDIEKYEFMVFDEAHNYLSDRMLAKLGMTKRYKLGLSATLSRADMKHWSGLRCFGYNLFRYGLTDAVSDGIVSRFRFHNISIPMPDVDYSKYEEISLKIRTLAMRKRQTGLDEAGQLSLYRLIDERKRILGMTDTKFGVLGMLSGAMRGRKIIMFNEYNAAAVPCYWRMLELGFRPTVFNSSIDKKRRNAGLDGYRSGRFDTIITTRALDEGYNLPEIDVGLILCGGGTSRQLIQRIGRVLRKKSGLADIYQAYYSGTIEEEHAQKRYELIRDACESYDEVCYSV